MNIEDAIKPIRQFFYDDPDFKNLTTNTRLYLISALIINGLAGYNDINLKNIEDYLDFKKCPETKMLCDLLQPALENPQTKDKLPDLYAKIKSDVIPFIDSTIKIDYAGSIYNALCAWFRIENDDENDVVLTPTNVANLMARLAQVNQDSVVYDCCMGTGSLLIAAGGKESYGFEILDNIYLLNTINAIIFGECSENLVYGDSLKTNKVIPADRFLLNPPYSAAGKGFVFTEKALKQMKKGYACILIQENAGGGQGLPYTAEILKTSTLKASIHMPDIFKGKAGVQTAIYLFETNTPHKVSDTVTFIDFSEDGYIRQNRKKSSQEINLRNTDHAIERYDEVVDLLTGKTPKTNYYTEANGKVIKDTISLNGDDWLFSQHQKISTMPTEDDFKKTVADYLSYKVSNLMRGA